LAAKKIECFPKGHVAGIESDAAIDQFAFISSQNDSVAALLGKVGHCLFHWGTLIFQLHSSGSQDFFFFGAFADL
jgi:hypothetical protein